MTMKRPPIVEFRIHCEHGHDLSDGDARQLLDYICYIEKLVFDRDIEQELHLDALNHKTHIIECASGRIIGGAPEESEEIIRKIERYQQQAKQFRDSSRYDNKRGFEQNS